MFTFVVGTCRLIEEEARLVTTLWTVPNIVELARNERHIAQTIGMTLFYVASHLFWQGQSKEPPFRTVFFENVNTSIQLFSS